jgi:Cation/multidrug efflux pump
MTTDGFSDKELDRYAELVKREIQNIDGISRVEIYGKRNECINIELLQDKMANLGVHPAEVISTLNGQNKTVYSGYFESGDNRLRVSVNDKYKNVDDIKSLILEGHENDQLTLNDIANVSIGYEEPTRSEMFYDSKRAFGISIAAQSGMDITKLGKKVEKRLEQLKQNEMPVGIEFNKIFFQSERVTDALNTFLVNLVESVIIVVLILMFTMGFKSGMIIGISLITIVFGSFMILNFFHGTLQRVSLGAFILAMGMLVDNAIVIVDGILVDLKRGVERREALTAIGRKTAMPLLGATLIAILAFLPLFLSPDTAGTYVRDLFVVLSVSLMLSLILALIHIPLMADRALNVEPAKSDEQMYNSKAYQLLRKFLSWLLVHKSVSIITAIALVAVSCLCYRFLPQEFFPDMNYDQVYIEYKLPEGNNSTRVEKDLHEIEKYLLSQENITHVTSSVGGTPSRYNLVRSIALPSISYGELIVDFTSPKELVNSIDELQKYLTANYPDAYVRIKRYNLMYKKYPIELQFMGPDPKVLKDLTKQAEDIMKRNPKTTLVCNDWEPETPTLTVDYNQQIARGIGLSRNDVGISLLSSTGGIPTGSFYDGKYPQTIYIKCVDHEGKPISALDNIPVFSLSPQLAGAFSKDLIQGVMTGAVSQEDLLAGALSTVPLSQASHGIKIVWEDPVVVRYNGQRAMRAQCEPYGVSAETARQSLLKDIENIKLPDGYTYQWEGEAKASSRSTQYLFANLPLAIVLMIFILILLFKDYKKPLIIFCCIPLIFVGVVFGVMLSGKTFGFVAIVGVLGLIGMMIKNGIIIMDEITYQLSQGVAPKKALLDSSASRLRPVMMAALTTILGMVPLLGDDMFGSMAVTIMGGLLVGTLITLIFIPILYAVFFKIDLDD